MNKLPSQLTNYLTKGKFKHQPIEHRKVFTAYDTAATTRTPLAQVAKNVIIKAGDKLHLLVLPAHHLVDFKAVAKQLGVAANKVKIVTEQAIGKGLTLKKNTGLSSFGSMYKLPVMVEKELLKAKEVLFPAGTFVHSIKAKSKDFVVLEQAMVAKFGKVNTELVKNFKRVAKPLKRLKRKTRKVKR